MAMKIKPGEAVPPAEEPELETLVDESEPTLSVEPERAPNILSPSRMTELDRKAKEQVDRELTKKAADDYLAKKVAELRAEAGVGKPTDLAAHLNELVTFTLNLPDNGSEHIILNMITGKAFQRGVQYTEPRHVFNDLQWICFRNDLHERSRKGEAVYGNRMPVAQFSRTISGKTGAVN